jgi:hypothetical protein
MQDLNTSEPYRPPRPVKGIALYLESSCAFILEHRNEDRQKHTGTKEMVPVILLDIVNQLLSQESLILFFMQLIHGRIFESPFVVSGILL